MAVPTTKTDGETREVETQNSDRHFSADYHTARGNFLAYGSDSSAIK